MSLSIGDTVKVVINSETTKKRLAGHIGTVYGETTPSITLVEVIGEIKNDYAINVHFDELGMSFWFAPELLEFIDHSTGTEMTLDSVNKKWTRNIDGRWNEENLICLKKAWWKFW